MSEAAMLIAAVQATVFFGTAWATRRATDSRWPSLFFGMGMGTLGSTMLALSGVTLL